MVEKKLMDGKVCPNHPEIDAVSRCTTCFKPLCAECILCTGGLDFCSDQCSTNHFTTNAAIEDGFAREAAARRRARIKKVIFLIILIVAGIIGWKVYQGLSPEKKKSLMERATELKDGAVEKAKDAKKAADKKLNE
ncbi:hypothetical protein BVY04_02395 [bacterium M21]|nr:hypothetical protein BVY04_02395 [bacterium M21]